MFHDINKGFSMPFHVTSRIRLGTGEGGDEGAGGSYGTLGSHNIVSTASKNPKKPQIRKKIKAILKKRKKGSQWWDNKSFPTPEGKFIKEEDRIRTALKKKKQNQVYSGNQANSQTTFSGSGGTK